jgi:hypothetical protein
VGALGGDNIAVDQPFNWSGNSWCNGLRKMGLCRETFLILWLHMLLTKCMFGFLFLFSPTVAVVFDDIFVS